MNQAQREMTLAEYVGKLPCAHAARLEHEMITALRTENARLTRELAVSRAKARAFDLWHSKACDDDDSWECVASLSCGECCLDRARAELDQPQEDADAE